MPRIVTSLPFCSLARATLLLTVLAALAACSSNVGGAGASAYSLPVGNKTTEDGGTNALKDGAVAGAADATASAVSDASAADSGKTSDIAIKPDILLGPGADHDGDSDGYTPNQGDCNDKDGTVHPKAIELCDFKDNDCNGMTDDFDKDGDGFSPCGAGETKDCDDTEKSVHPGAKTNCNNGLDNDCSGGIDSEEDVDNDGFPECKDCDDNDPDVFPGAAQKCSNNKDNNCDGVIDATIDKDKDGSLACYDCDDNDPKRYPKAKELCDKIDNDCNDVVDDSDDDGDSFSGCPGPGSDCDDNDINVHPGGVRNCKNGKDNDCDGIIDAQEDGDKDGYAGCADCNDSNPLISPGAVEYPVDNIDNNCNGQTDETPTPCDVAGLGNAPADYAKAMDLCVGVQSATWATEAAGNAHAIKKKYGAQNPAVKGPNLIVLSSGIAAAVGDPGYVSPQGGTSFSNSAPYPPITCKSSGTVYDYTELKLVLKVPANVQAFSFDFNFMSAEYPEWVGSSFNDQFVAVLDSKAFKGNVSFDSKKNCIGINSALFNVCNGCPLGAAALAGTGYDGGIGGGTGWLTTTAPVTPGETITLRFMIFDESDHILDSAVLIDDFRWLLKAKAGGPSTVRPGGG